MKLLDKNTHFFGLDIGATAIRCVELKHEKDAMKLVTYGEVTIDEQVSQSESDQSRERLANTISQLLKDARVSTNTVVTGLSSRDVYSSIITIPSLDQKELDQVVRNQAEQHIPMAIKEAQLDWTLLGQDEAASKSNVLLVASQKKNTEKLLHLLESIDLDVKAMEPNAVAATRAVASPSAQGAMALVDVGGSTSDIAILYGRNPWVIRSAPVGGNTLTKMASQSLNVDMEQASQFVQKFGMTHTKLEGQVYNALKPSVDNLISEISKSIKFFASQYQNVAMEKVILTGRVANWPDFPVYLADNLNLPVEIANAWTNVSYGAHQQEELMNISTRFAVASGLAQRE